jgi:hypothetical protein
VAEREATNNLNKFSPGNIETATAKAEDTNSFRVALTNPY